MDSTSIEDFQNYHNHHLHSKIDDDPNSISQARCDLSQDPSHDVDYDSASLSGSAHHSLDEAVFEHPTRTSSPRTSNGSEDDISVLESHYEPSYQKSPPFTPLEPRSRFRNPSSVRAMQMDTTPPHLASPSSQQRHKLYTPSRQCTPRSARSHRSAMSSPSKLSPTKKMRKEYPLVLLHVTLLPVPLHYSQEILETVLPPVILENWKLLQEKATDTVLERGVLIPHPKEDYDLLEERLLESLDLKTPRILKCGHFHLSPEEEADILAGSDGEDPDDDGNDLDICFDCGRHIRNGKYGSTGTGNKRWEIKLFAANGLMRAGAWSAAWREMERVDVEILPWMEEDMKRELELRREEEDRARAEAKEEGVGGLDDDRLREIYGEEARAFVDGQIDETAATVEMAARQMGERKEERAEEVPLWELLKRYLYHMGQDRRNIAIFVLSLFVLVLSIRPLGGRSSMASQPLQPSQPIIHGSHGMPTSGIQSMVGERLESSLQPTSAVSIAQTLQPTPDAADLSTSLTASSSDAEPTQSEEPESMSDSWIESNGDDVNEMIED